MKWRYVWTWVMAFSPLTALADERIESVLRARFDGDRTGACVQAALIEGASVRRASFCARGSAAPPADAAFEIGSVTKTMTAILVADLIERGLWSLDDPIAKHLPPGTTVPRQGARQILVRDIVTHSSGLPPLPALMQPARQDDPYATLTEQQLLDSLAQARLTRPIGSQPEYSNFAMMVLSLAVSRADGRGPGGDLERALRERLFEPLKMSGSHVVRAPAGQPLATGHLSTGEATVPWTITPSLAGVGMVRAPMADMVRYAQAVLNPDGTALGAAIRRTLQPLAHGFGMNWLRSQVGDAELVAHEGGTGGFSSTLVLWPARQQAVVLLADTALADLGSMGDVAMALLGRIAAPQPPRRAVVMPETLRQALPGDYDLAGMTLRISERDGRVFARAAGQPEIELRADSRGDLYPTLISALMTPQLRGGRVETFVWRQGGGALEGRRLGTQRAYTAQNPAWQPWAGEYALLPGLDLRVFEEGGRLMLQGSGQGAFAVEVIGDDEVESKAVGVRVRFRRNAQGEVIGITFMQGGQTLQAPRK